MNDSVTKAAERLFIGQSAASSALGRLREYFGDDLLVMVGRRMDLTPLAKSLVEPVRATLLQVRSTIAKRPAFDPQTESRRFVICASDYVTTILLSKVVAKIASEAPGVMLAVRSPPKNLAEALERGNIDLVILPAQYIAPLKLPTAKLFSDTHTCMVWSQHASLGHSMTLKKYMEYGHVAVHFGGDRGLDFEDWFVPTAARHRRVESSVDNFATLPSLVIGTQRIATLHHKIAQHFALYMPLRLIPAPFKMPPVVETMAWPRRLEKDDAHAWLRHCMISCAREVDASK